MSDATNQPHITVVGDLILDRYLIGDVTKLNPEMPGVVIRIDKEEDRLGGAAAVAMIAAGFGAKVTLAGVIGEDEAGEKLLELVSAHGIEPHICIDDRPTTWKQRVVARGQLRPDRYDREVATPIGVAAEQFLSNVAVGDVVLISDYGKGACSGTFLRTLAVHACDSGVPVLVDPARSRDWSDYPGAQVIKANLMEAREAVDSAPTRPETLASSLSRKHACSVVVTLGERGLVCAEFRKDSWLLPAPPTTIRDACGAGDTAFAAIGFAISLGWSIRQACQAAVKTAAKQVASIGVTPVCWPFAEKTPHSFGAAAAIAAK